MMAGPRRRIGIIGNGADKFTTYGAMLARGVIARLLMPEGVVVVSGHSPVGGVDVWAEDIAQFFGGGRYDEHLIFAPSELRWSGGYRERNREIAANSDELHIVVADRYPDDYEGRRFGLCYHDGRRDHVKSGACWTGARFREVSGKEPVYHIVRNYSPNESRANPSGS